MTFDITVPEKVKDEWDKRQIPASKQRSWKHTDKQIIVWLVPLGTVNVDHWQVLEFKDAGMKNANELLTFRDGWVYEQEDEAVKQVVERLKFWSGL